jgi:hypothetical protein
MRRLHRWTMTVFALLVIYVATTGLIIQLIDMRTLYSHAPAIDPNLQSIREGTTGPPGFSVISTADYAAASLPEDLDPQKLLAAVQTAARAAIPSETFSWVELRMDGPTPVGIVAVGGLHVRHYKFNALTGALMGSPSEESPMAAFTHGPPSAHDTVKAFHRGDVIGKIGPWIGLLVGLALFFLTISGLTVYFNMLAARQRSGRGSWFWR